MHPIKKELIAEKERLLKKGVLPDTIRILVKERLQDHALYAIYTNREYKQLVFYGGTCLRKVFGLNRMSEDLDFEVDKKPKLSLFGKYMIRYFEGIELDGVTAKVQEGARISRVTLKFPILYNLGLSGHHDEKLHLKIEINNRLTGIYPTVATPHMIGRFSTIIRHYDIETMMACKMVACMERVFKKGNSKTAVKGRDYYDLLWFMQQGVKPNEQKLLDSVARVNVKKAFLKLDAKVVGINKGDLFSDLRFLFEDEVFIRDWCDNFHDMYKRFRKKYK